MPHEIPFGRYELIQRLALGGMAELFLARVRGEGGFAKTCVVKRVLPHLVQDDHFVQMFLREGRLAATLNHPNLVQVFELGKVEQDYFLAMEYLAGEDLASLLDRARELQRPIPLEIAARIIREVCAGLHYAHERTHEDGSSAALIHRDISPSNLFVTYHGHVKVLDFGIAREDAAERYTRSGEIRGKPSYMAPEQLTHQPFDRRVDVWATGVCLFELLSGDRLFRGRSTPETVVSVCREPIPALSTLRPDVPPSLDAILFRALERDPERRYPTAHALGEDLERVLGSLQARTSAATVAAYLRDLFGEARAEQKVARERGTRPPGPATGVVPDESAAASTTTVHTVAQRPGRRTLLAIWGMAFVMLATVGGTWWWRGEHAEGPRPQSGDAFAAGAYVAPPIAVGATVAVGGEGVAPPSDVSSEDVAPSSDRAPAGDDSTVAAGSSAHGAAAVPAAAGAAYPSDATASASGSVADAPAKHAAFRPARSVAARRETTGHVTLKANAPVVAWLGRKRLGPLPLHKQRLPAGEHRVRLVNESLGLERVVEVAVAAGRETELSVRVGKGRLNIDADPWADVFLDGTAIGQTPMTREVWEGPHRLRLVGPNGEKTVKVTVRANGVSVVREKLP